MRCQHVKRALGEYLDGALPIHGERAVAEHLRACVACEAEVALLRRSLGALEDLGGDGMRRGAWDRGRTAAPDADALWAALQTRIATTEADARRLPRLDCPRVGRRLPAYHAEELPAAEALAVTRHLEDCSRCAAEAAALERALELIDRLPPAQPPRDMWPALAARLQPRPTGWRSAGALLRPAWSPPARALAGGLAVAALAAAWLWPQLAPAPADPGSTMAHVGAGEQSAPAPEPLPPQSSGGADVVNPARGLATQSPIVRPTARTFRVLRGTRLASGRRPRSAPRRPRLLRDGGPGDAAYAAATTMTAAPAAEPPPVVIVTGDSPLDLREIAYTLAPMGESLENTPDVGSLLGAGVAE
jgi:anti-sigma factor RsiW